MVVSCLTVLCLMVIKKGMIIFMVRKRVLKIAAVALGLAIMVYGFSAQWFVIPDENMAQESEAADTAESAEPVLTQTMISGRVLSDGLATITIEDSDGNDYIFVRNDAEIQVPERGIEVGAPVTVTYVGVLSAGGLQGRHGCPNHSGRAVSG